MTVPCAECAALGGQQSPLGGLLYDDGELVVHAVLGGSPLAGWLVVAPRRHLERLDELAAPTRDRLFALANAIGIAQREVLGAEKSYLGLFAEVVPHLHVHVVPRYADTPASLRGPRCFAADDAQKLAADVLATAAERLGHALATATQGALS